MRIGDICSYTLTVFLLFISISQSYAQPHTHGGRSHTHGLPTQGVGHRHNNGAAGQSSGSARITNTPKTKIKPKRSKDFSLYQGYGTQSFGNGTFQYAGNFLNGQRSGKGTMTHKNVDKYTGDFRNGVYSGKGTLTNKEGDKYVGDFQDGFKEGKGTYYFKSGNKYIGDFYRGNRTGQGTFIWTDGEKYIGDFKYGKRNGKGTYYFKNGNKYTGDFKKGEFISGTIYKNGIVTAWPNKSIPKNKVQTNDIIDKEPVQRKPSKENQFAEQKEKSRQTLNEFSFHRDRCNRPKVPGFYKRTDAVNYIYEKAKPYAKCLDNASDRDYSDLKWLIRDLGGKWKERGGDISWELPDYCECREQIKILFSKLNKRVANRVKKGIRYNNNLKTQIKNSKGAMLYNDANPNWDKGPKRPLGNGPKQIIIPSSTYTSPGYH